MEQETFLKLFGGTGTDFLNNSAELAAQKLATGIDNQITATGGEPPADAFNYFNNDFFNQDNSGILGTDQAQNTLSANPILASELNAARNLGVPQDNRFTGILKNTVARPLMFQAGANVGLTAGNLLGVTNPLLALAGAIGSQFLPLGRSKPGMDYQYVNQPGGVNVVDNKITTGVLAGKNFESAFGSRDLGEMYQNYIDQFEDEEDLSDFQKSQKEKAEAELRAYLTTGAKMRGYRDSVTNRTMTPREFAFNYNQGIGQFAMPTTDATGKTLDYTGESDTYSGGESTPGDDTSYSDPYDPGGGE
jgi:hypothetical protein